MSSKYSTQQQHEPLRVPSNWGAQEKRFAAQLEEILDDIYRRFGRLKISDLGDVLKKTISDAEGNAYQAIQTANGFEERIKDAEGNAAEALRTASGFEERISDAEGNASEALQTANGFEQRVSDAEGKADNASSQVGALASTVSQTTKNFTAEFNRIGLAGAQTGIVSATENGVKVSHSNINSSTELNADGMRVKDSSGKVIGGTFMDSDGELVSLASVIKHPNISSFQAHVATQDEAYGVIYGLGLFLEGELVGIVGGTPSLYDENYGVTIPPSLRIVTPVGRSLSLRAVDTNGNVSEVNMTDGDITFVTPDADVSINDLANGGGSGNVKFAFGHTSVNDTDATILDYSSAGFTDIPYVCVNYSSPTRWSGDAGALKVYYKTATQANVIVGGSFPTSREIDWIAIGR